MRMGSLFPQPTVAAMPMPELANIPRRELTLRRVLLVEDSPAHSLICEEAIRSQAPHFQVESVQNGENLASAPKRLVDSMHFNTVV